MAKCDYCEDEIDYLPFTCRYCGKSYCKKHRIPENHECTFEFKNDPFKVMARGREKSTKVYADYPAESYPKPSSDKRARIRDPGMRNRSRPQVTTLLGMQAKPYGTYGLMIANVIFFAISMVLLYINYDLQNYLFLSFTDYTENYSYWTFLSSMFLSVGPLTPNDPIGIFLGFLYLFIKVFMLFFIGRMIETRWGWKTLIKIYLLSGVLASVGILALQLIGSLFIENMGIYQYFSSWGATMGLIAFISFLFPQQQITMFLYFIPIRVKMKNLLWILIGIAVVPIIFNVMVFPQNIGGLLGILGGLIIFRQMRRGN